MSSQRGHNLVLAIYPQSRSFAFVLFDSRLVPVDWGVHDTIGAEKNVRCIRRVAALLDLYALQIVVLQDTSAIESHRRLRIKTLNRELKKQARLQGISVRTYSRARVLTHFEHVGATRKQEMAELI